jgi:hypothetical protein
MRPQFAPASLRDTKPWEYAIRFVFGGLITVATGLIANAFGPAVAGLFLAFPSILPASITLVKRHDGRARAVDDARGARLGSIGLVAFALVVTFTATALHPVLVLSLATLTWVAVDVTLWRIRFGGGLPPGS